MGRKFSDRYLLGMAWGYISNHLGLFAVASVALLLNVVLSILGPVMLNFLLNAVETGDPLLPYILGYIVFNALSWLARVFQMVNVTRLNARVVKEIRDSTFSNILENKIPFFDVQKSGELTSRVVNDTKELSELGMSMASFITDLLRVLLTIAFFLYLSPILGLFFLLFIPVVMVISILMSRWERRESSIWRHRFGEVNARFSDIMSKIAISKAFNREEENLNRFREINEATYRASVKRGLAIFLFWPMTDLMQHALRLIIIAVGIWQISNGLPLVNFIMFIVLLGYFYWPLINLANKYNSFQVASASLERIARVSEDMDLREDDGSTLPADGICGEIVFRDVDFSYDGENLVLSNINFSISPGERVALVGHTGAGKSTIASLLVRFYEVSDGSITVDGHDIKEYDLCSLRRAVGLVSQRVLLFKGTIRENLLIANPEADDARMWEVLDMVQAREFIELLPEGLDSRVEENGKNLSAGQKQMISFARAVLSDPRVIVLDEATSAVDLYTETKIQDAIETLLSSRTSVSIAHRLTTILKSDKIIVLDHGRIVQVGSHEELLAQGGMYSEMYNLYLETQSAKYLEKIKY